MHTMWFKSSLFNLEFIDQSELGLTSTNSQKLISTVLKYEFNLYTNFEPAWKCKMNRGRNRG